MKIVCNANFLPIPSLTILDAESRAEERVILERNSLVSISFSEGHYCVSCLKEIISGSECSECAFANAFKICLQCRGDKCLQYEKELLDDCFNKSYCVYLALFGTQVKAGVSKEHRFEQRLLEQGADAGVRAFARLNGKAARFVENLLFAKGLLEKVQAKQKIEWLNEKPDAEKLAAAKEKARMLKEFEGNFVEEKPLDFSSSYAVPKGKISETDVLSGVVVGWKGPLVFLKRQGYAVFPLSKALGKSVEVKKTLAEF